MGILEHLIASQGRVAPRTAQQLARKLIADAARTPKTVVELGKLATRVAEGICRARGTAAISISDLTRAMSCLLAGTSRDVFSLVNAALSKAIQEGWLGRNQGGVSADETSRDEWRGSRPSPRRPGYWKKVGLPERLAKLAQALEKAGGEASAYDLAQELQEPPSKILADHKERWGDWIDRFIDRPRRGVLRLK